MKLLQIQERKEKTVPTGRSITEKNYNGNEVTDLHIEDFLIIFTEDANADSQNKNNSIVIDVPSAEQTARPSRNIQINSDNEDQAPERSRSEEDNEC